MAPALSSAPAASANARPVDEGERLNLLDTLRGFALCGVFLANVYLWFSGRMFLSRAQKQAVLESASWLDTSINQAFVPLISGRFITIFSFLFGLGFAVQLGRAESRGASVIPVYARRLVVMLGVGLAHLFLLFQGDIVSTYALLGFTLLLFHKRSDRTLLIWAAALIFLGPVLWNIGLRLPELPGSPGAEAAAKAAMEKAMALRAQALEAFSHGSWLDTVRMGAACYRGDLFWNLSIFLPVIVGRFLLGLWAGRRRLFHDAPQHLRFFRRLLGWGLGLGLFAIGMDTLIGQLLSRKIINFGSLPWLRYAMEPMRHLGELGMASFYVAGITLLFQRDTWRRRLAVLAPVGRMGLTNYLLTSVMGVLLFYGYGLGLMGKLGSAAQIALTLVLFALQTVFSHLWLARFRFGPVEWVTRSLTYGKAQPMRRAPVTEDKEMVSA
ncbi:DUF418 domain-containing protein [Archangium lansingense]|uniref:DUF418 domain-containing protein n=1 Tax=Archangium lansingense TaxID=2995310 RepID=A0ABT4AIQ8_9BACT|nr:DUF418 domain-containing protein [Archangium lansinium]MCY1081461.1 DUF418 domain-containing protein [Archangium lansinium]